MKDGRGLEVNGRAFGGMKALEPAVAVEDNPDVIEEVRRNNVLWARVAQRNNVLLEHTAAARAELAEELC